jgi:hypothetical protein
MMKYSGTKPGMQAQQRVPVSATSCWQRVSTHLLLDTYSTATRTSLVQMKLLIHKLAQLLPKGRPSSCLRVSEASTDFIFPHTTWLPAHLFGTWRSIPPHLESARHHAAPWDCLKQATHTTCWQTTLRFES